jgi:hypothetical protein
VTFEVAAHDGAQSRVGEIAIRDQLVNVVQTPR